MSRAAVLVTAADLAADLASASADRSPTSPVVLDVRWRLGEPHGAGEQRYAAAHLPGARFLDLEKVLTRHTGDPRASRRRRPPLRPRRP